MRTNPPLHSKLLAEFVGTFALCAVGIGAIVHGQGDLLSVALAHGLAIAVMVSAVGHVSGAHFNPAVSIAMVATRQMSIGDCGAFIGAQLAGAVAGAAAVKVAFGDLWTDKLATVALASDVSLGRGLLMEVIATFFLVWVIFAVAVDRDGAFFKIAGLPIGFTVSMGILMIGPLTGAALNPARWFGPNLLTGEFSDLLVWTAGPIIGGLLAGFAYMYGIRPRLPE